MVYKQGQHSQGFYKFAYWCWCEATRSRSSRAQDAQDGPAILTSWLARLIFTSTSNQLSSWLFFLFSFNPIKRVSFTPTLANHRKKLLLVLRIFSCLRHSKFIRRGNKGIRKGSKFISRANQTYKFAALACKPS